MRWLVLVLLAFSLFLVGGCDLNPQPEVPGGDDPEAAGGAAGAAGAWGGEVPVANDDDPGRSADSDPTEYSGGLQAGKAARPDAGSGREVPDAATDAQAPPPVVVAN